eukprot:TRINITY_DN101720_c0_g1_i1.p1 TRINITY_DN101720_c0_g1~~TRINITY_DN101720_c0_g1_i1.p1  ORF type:complete len:466 (+),score=93.14 TRINITY_DN101720_c0_g1_i1:74-1471(+)
MAAAAKNALRQVPEAGGMLGFVGGVARGLKENRPYQFLREWHNEQGPLLKVNMVAIKAVSVVDPNVVKWVTRNDPARFTKGKAYDSIKRGWLDNSLVVNEDEEWRRKRSIYNKAFKIGAIRSYVPLFQDIAEGTAAQWSQKAEKQELVDAVKGFESVALEAIGRAGFGVEGMGKPGNKYAHAFVSYLDVLQDEITKPVFLLLPQPLRQYITKIRGRDHLRTMNEEAMRITGADAAQPSRGEETRKNLVSLIKDAAAEEGSDLDPEQLAREANLFLFAGHDTTSASLAWVFASLGSNPEIQQKAYEEVSAVAESELADAFSDPRSFPYVGACIRETLRLYPPANIVMRKSKFDEELGGYAVPAGTELGLNIWCMHRDPEAFEEPDAFTPERWLTTDTEQLKRMQDYFVPFMVGARSCIGQHFSMMEMKIVIASLLRRFSVELASSPQVKQRMLLLPDNILLRCKAR